MFCGIDFMAIWFFLKESVLILLVSIVSTAFSTDFSKVLTKVKFSPENSIALNKFLEQLLIKHENLEWVDQLQTHFNDIGLSNFGLEMRKRISKRNDRRYRKRRKLVPYYREYRNQNNQNFNLDELAHLNIDDYENALTGVLKKEGYKKQRVKQKRYITETPVTTHKYKNHTIFDLLDLSIINPAEKDRTNNYQSWISNNNLRKVFAKNKLKKQAITADDYVERSTNCSPKSTVNIKAEELDELMKVVEPTTKKKPINKHNWPKNKTLSIMDSKKKELTITKSFDTRQKDDVSSQNKFESTSTPIIFIVMESSPTGKSLEKKSITMPDSNKSSKSNVPVDMISKKTKIQNHLEKNIFLNNPYIEQQIDASPTNANIKSINLERLHLMTDPYVLRFTKTTVPNLAQPNNLQKREKIIEVNPASVMSPEEIRRAKIEAKKLLDVDKDFNERNEPDFNKEVMQTTNNDYKEIYDYWENLKDKINQKQKSNSIQSVEKILKPEEKREIKGNENQQNRFFSRQLLHYNYGNDYENELYSDYDDQENSLRRYPRDVNEDYRFQNVDDDYFDYRNEQPLKRRFYKRRWKKEANSINNDKGLFSKSTLRNKISKLKNFFGIGHENNYNEKIEDDYPVENMSIDDYTAKNNELIDDNISDKLQDLQNIIVQHDSENVNTENSFEQKNARSQNSFSRTTFETKTDKNNHLSSLDSNQKSKQNNKTPVELNPKTNSLNLIEKSNLKESQKNNRNYFEQTTLPATKTSTQITIENQNSVQNDLHRNLEISSIIGTFLNHNNGASKETTAKTTNTQTSKSEKLTLYDFTRKLETSTTPSNPLSYSFTYKMNLFDPKFSSISNSPLSKEIVNFREKLSKRELSVIKNWLKHHKTKQNSKINPENPTTAELNNNILTKASNDGKIIIDKSLSLNDKKNKNKLTHKHKFHHLPKYHSELKDLLKVLPPQIPVAQMHVDELKLNAIKKTQEKNKKTHANIKSREATDYRSDSDEEDYILGKDYNNFDSEIFNDDEELKHSGIKVKHDIKSSDDSKKCGNKHKSHKHRPDIEEEINAMKVAGRPKIEDNLKSTKNSKEDFNSDGNRKKSGKANTAKEAKNAKKDSHKKNNDKQDTQLFYTEHKNNVHQNVLKHSCESSTTNKTKTTNTCSTKHLTTKCPTMKETNPSETCKTPHPTTTCLTTSRGTTCPTTCKTTTCPTTCKTTTCPTTHKTTCSTTCKTTTCPTTHKTTTCPTTHKTTTGPTTHKTTTCPTTHKTTTCPTTHKTTTCPTTHKTTTFPTTHKTTTCPTTHKTTTCPTTHKTTTGPTTHKTTTCPTTHSTTTCPTTHKTTTCLTTHKTTTCPTTHETTTCPTTHETTTCPTTHNATTLPTTTTCETTSIECPTTCKTTCSVTETTSCKPTCVHFYSTHKFSNRFKRKNIENSQYFNKKYHKAKFNADRLPRHLIFPKKKYIYNDMPKNEYQQMKHKNLIGRLKRKYFPKQNKCFAEPNKNHLIRRKKSINLNKDMKHVVEMPIYKMYPKRVRFQRYRRRKMKSDDAEDEKQRKVLETIYHHRIQRRRNEPEYVRKSHSYDYTIENNAYLPSSYNCEVRRNLIRRTTMENLKTEDIKGTTTSSDSAIYSDALKGKVSAKVVQDLYMDLNKSKDIKNIIGKDLRNPRRDPNNPFPNLKNCEKENSGKQLQRILDDFVKKLDSVKVTTNNCAGLDKDSQLFLKIITRHIKNSNDLENEESGVPAQNMILFSDYSTSNGATTMNETKTSLDPCTTDKSPTTSSDVIATTTTAKTLTTAKTTTTVKATTTAKTTTKKYITTKANKTKSTKSTTNPCITATCESTSDPCKTNLPTINVCETKPSETDLCKTIIISPDPSKTKSSATDPCLTKSSTTDPCLNKSSTTDPKTKITKTKATKTTTVKCTTAKATKTTKTKTTGAEISKTQTKNIKSSPVCSIAPTEKNKNKMWEKPSKLKIEVFKLDQNNANCNGDSDTTESNKPQKQNTRKKRIQFKRKMGNKESQTLKSPINAHKLSKFSDVQATIHKIPLTHQEVKNLLAMYNKLPVTERKRNKYIYNYLHTQKLFLERLMHQFKKYNHEHRNIRLRKRQNFHERHQHVVWVPNELSGFSEDSKYIKLKKRMINNNQIENFRSRIKRENYFRDVMRTRRQPEARLSKMDEWMKVNNEEHTPLYLNFTF